MHELSIALAIRDCAERFAEGRPVAVVHVRVGAMRQVVPSALAFAWDAVAREGLCAGAALDQRLVPTRLRCEGCGAEWEPSEPWFRCAACAGAGEVIAGGELEIESIEVEEAGCTA